MPDNWLLKLVLFVPFVVAFMFLIAFCSSPRSSRQRDQPLPLSPSEPSPSVSPAGGAPNNDVAGQLNMADMLFKESLDGCMNVNAAIMAANSPEIFGPTSAGQRSELKRYADRCGLRFQP